MSQLATAPTERIRLSAWPEAARFGRVLRRTDSFLDAVACQLGAPPLTTLSAKVDEGVPLDMLDPDIDGEAIKQLDLFGGALVQVRAVEWAHDGVWVAGARSLVVPSRLDLKARAQLREGVPLGQAIGHLGRTRHPVLITPRFAHPTLDPRDVVFDLHTRLDIATGEPVAWLVERVGMVVITGHHEAHSSAATAAAS